MAFPLTPVPLPCPLVQHTPQHPLHPLDNTLAIPYPKTLARTSNGMACHPHAILFQTSTKPSNHHVLELPPATLSDEGIVGIVLVGRTPAIAGKREGPGAWAWHGDLRGVQGKLLDKVGCCFAAGLGPVGMVVACPCHCYLG